MLERALLLLLVQVLGALGELLVDFIRAQRRNVLDAQLIADIDAHVAMVAAEHPDWPDAAKRAHVVLLVRLYLERHELDLKDSLVNALIELSVQRLKVRTE